MKWLTRRLPNWTDVRIFYKRMKPTLAKILWVIAFAGVAVLSFYIGRYTDPTIRDHRIVSEACNGRPVIAEHRQLGVYELPDIKFSCP